MKKLLTLLVAALTAVSFASVAMASSHLKKEEAKPAEAAAPAVEKAVATEKKDVKKVTKAKKVVKKKEGVAKPAKKGKKEVSGC